MPSKYHIHNDIPKICCQKLEIMVKNLLRYKNGILDINCVPLMKYAESLPMNLGIYCKINMVFDLPENVYGIST